MSRYGVICLFATLLPSALGWAPPPGACKASPSKLLQRAVDRAGKNARRYADFAGKATANLFTWEHERAARNERFAEYTSYWDDPRIHNFGNVGWRGWLHAAFTPLATHAIDRFAYSNYDVRAGIHDVANGYLPAEGKVVDLCCGAAYSSAPSLPGRELVGVDTSLPMLTVGALRRRDVAFEQGNAEHWGADACCDVATVMYAFHEMPSYARRRVVRNAVRIATSSVIIVDIHTEFEPSPMMLAGEPYILDYLANVDEDIVMSLNLAQVCARLIRCPTPSYATPSGGLAGEQWTVTKQELVEGHVHLWRIERNALKSSLDTFDI